MSTQLAVVEDRPLKREMIQVIDPIPVLDSGRFEHMQRIATVMAKSSLIPESLCMAKDDSNNMARLPDHVVLSNCFLVVNQAVRWNMDPFAVAQCVSVVKGKLCYEGKLIAAVIEAKIGAELEYDISDAGEAMKVVVSAAVNGQLIVDSKGRPKTVEGTVGEWKTTGNGSPWGARGGFPRMLRYRGAREWGRTYRPGLMLGVYSDDEMADLADNARSLRSSPMTRLEPPAPPPITAPEAPKVVATSEPPAPPPADIVSPDTGEIRAPQEIATEIVSELGDAINEEMLDHILDARTDELEQLPRDLFAKVEDAANGRRAALRMQNPLAAG